MNSKKLISTIVLLVIAVALAVVGCMGLNMKKEEEAKADSPFTLYTEDSAFYTAESESFIRRGEHAIANVEGYLGQIGANIEALGAIEGADVATATSMQENVSGLLESAKEKLASMQESHGKLIGVGADLTEQSAAEDITKEQNKLPKYRNKVKNALKEITKIEAFEAKKSIETTAKEACETTAAMLSELDPENEILGSQFTGNEWTEEAVSRDAVTGNFLAKNYEVFFWLAGVALVFAIMGIIGMKSPATYAKINGGVKKNMMLVALIVIVLFFFVSTQHAILTPTNVSNIITQNAYIIIMACGMLLCIVCSANIDLSVGRVIGFVSACAAKFMIEGGMNTPILVIVAILACLLIGILIGCWQGFWISYMGIPAFVVTLADQLLFYGLTMVILKGFTISGFPALFETMFNAYIGDIIPGLFAGVNSTAVLVGIIAAVIIVILQIKTRRQRISKGYYVEPLIATIVKTIIVAGVVLWLFIWLARNKGIPTVLITVGLVLLLYSYITSKTVIGRHLYAMGGNRNAARLSGVKTDKLLFLAYVNMGFLAALAGLVYASRLNGASPQAGAGDETYAIASCYIGGASAAGGIGTIGGALIGALTMGVIKNGMSIMSLGQDVQQIVLGMVLLLAVVIDVLSKQKINLPFLQKKAKKSKKAA